MNLEFASCLAVPDSVDLVIASHVLEHISNIITLMREIHNILKPGGHLIALTPYASSNDAWEDITHVRAFTENSWIYFDRRTHETDGHHGSYQSCVDFIFEAESITLTPFQFRLEMLDDLGLKTSQDRHRVLSDWIKRERNVIQEMVAILKAVK
jgi:SAM-dependent methyltransferase